MMLYHHNLVFTASVLSLLVAQIVPTTLAVNITYVSGTCKKTVPTFNMSAYYNQDSILVTDMNGVNVSSSSWDLGRDGAFTGYNVMYCSLTPTTYGGYLPTAVLQLIQQKGFNVTQSCNMAGLLAYPTFHVFILVDRTESVVISNADANAVAAFYTLGGGLYSLTDNCPYNYNMNLIYSKMPDVLSRFRLWHNNNIRPTPLTLGNPAADNQFGNHVVFTGVASMSSGDSLTIPYYDGAQSTGVFANLCTILIQMAPYVCANEPAASYVRAHATMMYVDPPTQLYNISGACNWGRIVADTAWTRYGVAPLRTGSHRLAANIVVYLLNIERVVERNVSGDPYAIIPCNSTSNTTTSSSDSDQTQVLGCSVGDDVTLLAPTMICSISFSGPDAPNCLALIITETQGTTCVVDLSSARIGTYWFVVNGQNSSLTFTVTAASLIPRGTVTAVTGTCMITTETFVTGCTDGSSITIDWTLPYPASFTLGSTASICSNFSVVGTSVYCQFLGLSALARGTYLTYINGVSTGIPLKIQTYIASVKHALCSTPTFSFRTPTITLSPTATLSRTMTLSPTTTLSRTMTLSPTTTQSRTMTLSPTIALSSTITLSPTTTLSRTMTLSPTTTLSRTMTLSPTTTQSRTMTLSPTIALSSTITLSPTVALPPTISLSPTITMSPTTTLSRTMTLSPTRLSPTITLSPAIVVARPRLSPTTMISHETLSPEALSSSHASTVSKSVDVSRCQAVTVVVALAPIASILLLSTFESAAVVIVTAASQSPNRSDNTSTPTVALYGTPVARQQLLSLVPIGINITLHSASSLCSAAILLWKVGNVTYAGQLLNFTSNTPSVSPWNAVMLQPPSGGLIGLTPLLSATTFIVTITMNYGADVVLKMIITIPAPASERRYAEQVKSSGTYSQIVSIAAGGLSTGSALGRVMATRSTVLCDADSSVDGGVIDLDLTICSLPPSESAAATARSAIVSNVVLIGVVAGVFLVLVALWAWRTGSSFTAAAWIFCLPSSLLPAWTVVVPSTVSSSTLLLARINTSECRSIDMILGIVGLGLSISPCTGFLLVWYAQVSGPASWECIPRPLHTESSTWVIAMLQKALHRAYAWVVCDGPDDGEDMIGAAWVVLLEYRDLPYGAFDSFVLAAISCVSVASGLTTSDAQCRGWSLAVMVLLVAQLAALLALRPFTTIFSTVYNVVTLVLTILSTLTQVVFVWVYATDSSGLWLVNASSGISLAIVGVSAVKMLVDAWQAVVAVRRRVAMLCSEPAPLETAPGLITGRQFSFSYLRSQYSDEDELAEDEIPRRRGIARSKFQLHLDSLPVRDEEFWDDSGNALHTGVMSEVPLETLQLDEFTTLNDMVDALLAIEESEPTQGDDSQNISAEA